MKRYEMVKSHEEFNEIINKGNKIKDSPLAGMLK